MYFFPEINENEFKLVSEEKGSEFTEDLPYVFRVYERK